MNGITAQVIGKAARMVAVVEELKPNELGDLLVVDFPASQQLDLQIAEEVQLALSGGALGNPVRAAGRVMFLARDEIRSRCGFQLDDEAKAILSTPRNRRQAFRVKPSAQAPLKATLATLEGEPLGPQLVEDISATGICLFVDRDQESVLAPHWDFDISLRLPLEL